MIRELKGLLKRDFYLLFLKSRKRIGIYLLVLLGANISFVLLGSSGYALESVRGISAENFRESLRAPYYFIAVSCGPVLISIDFVREDLYSHGSNILVKLKKRESYWISKMIAQLLLCISLGLAVNIMGCAVQNSLGSWQPEELYLYNQSAIFSAAYNALCAGACITAFSLASLVIREIPAFVLSLVFLCWGLGSSNKMALVNNCMLARLEGDSDLHGIAIYLLVIIVIAIFMGSYLVKKADICERGK